MKTRSTRSKSVRKASTTPRKRKLGPVSDDDVSVDELSDAYEDDSDEDVKSLDSDALDDDNDFQAKATSPRKRKSATRSSPRKRSPAKSSPRKKGKKAKHEPDDSTSEKDYEVVGKVVEAPKTGKVPAGQISRNTLNFLLELQDPECNDRQWFKLHEPVYRQAETEWKAFIEDFTDLFTEADPQIPPLPPKDVIHRIYRDIRFSNDKTPYKTNLSASFSRSGRKGIFAGYHVYAVALHALTTTDTFPFLDAASSSIKPGNNSIIAAGSWCPEKNELATIRGQIMRNPSRLRQVLAAPDFVAHFGEPKPHPDGHRRNIFGAEDELKVAPKGVDKTHPHIDLLKCRSFAVVHKFTDKEVLSQSFKHELARMVGILRPFVHCLNDYMTIPADEESNGSGNDDDE